MYDVKSVSLSKSRDLDTLTSQEDPVCIDLCLSTRVVFEHQLVVDHAVRDTFDGDLLFQRDESRVEGWCMLYCARLTLLSRFFKKLSAFDLR